MRTRRLTLKDKHKSKMQSSFWIVTKSAFPLYRIYTEYPFSKICGVKRKDLGIPRELFADIYILDIRLIIEVMGEQHYKPIKFGGGEEDAVKRFISQRRNDQTKRELIEKFDLKMLEVSHKSAYLFTSQNLLKVVDEMFKDDWRCFLYDHKRTLQKLESNGTVHDGNLLSPIG
jgi:hypothetical protein